MQSRHYPIILLFTVLQLVILLTFGYTPYPDSEGYITLANDALSHHQLYPVDTKINEYAFLWNLGAINIVQLSLCFFNSVMPLLVLYSIMKGATAWFLYAITEKLFSQRVAFIALCLYCLYPANYGESTSVHSELPFTFFMMLALWLCVCQQKCFMAGIALAVSNWIRPMGLVFLLSMLIYLFVNWRKSCRLIIGYVAIILIIGTINYQRTGLFLYQAKSGWFCLSDYSTNHSDASLAIRERSDLNVAQKDSAWQSLFMDWLKEHPTEYVAQMPGKLINTYVSDNVNMCAFIPDKANSEYMYDEISMRTLVRSFPRFSAVQWLTILNLLVYYLLLITAIWSLFYFRRENSLLPVSIILLGTLLLLFVGHGEARFHQPFMPFVIMLSASLIKKKAGV